MACARSWIATPYQHQASLKGVGCDCLGLVRGVWRELMGPEPEAPPAYTPDWAERAGAETLRDAARRHLRPRPLIAMGLGDVVLFRMRENARGGFPAKHAAIVSRVDDAGRAQRLIHAYWGRAVTETALSPWWRRRAAYAFSFPGVQ